VTPDTPTHIRPLGPADWPAVSTIYAAGIAGRMATFETEVPPWEAWDAAHLLSPRFVAELSGEVMGFAALSPVSRRHAYRGVAEVSVYVAPSSQGHGLGRALLEALIEDSERAGLWTLQATVFPENAASVRLHESLGFKVVGRRERIGQLDGQWRDTVVLERRSERVGGGGSRG
jgi:phosphinothricin acetyltransferase